MNLSPFLDKNLFEAGTSFFNQLKVPLNSNTTISLHLKDILKDKFKSQEIFEKVSATYFLGLVDSSVFDDNLSLFEDEKLSYEQADKKIHTNYEGMMIFAVRIDGIDSPTRTQLSDLTRAFNRASKNLPVVVLFQYGNFLTLATSKRTKYKQTWREGEKIGKNYLNKDELDILNRIVNFYLEFAKLQTLNRKPVYMRDWIAKLDDFLRISERNILTHAGKISHDKAIEKAQAEYEKYRRIQFGAPSPVEQHFAEAVKDIKRLEKEMKTHQGTKGKIDD